MEVMQTASKMQTTRSTDGAAGSASAGQAAAQAQAIQQAAQDAQVQRKEQNVSQKVETQEQMQQLVKKLNSALDPFRTSLKFGFDNASEDFYVSVIETKTNKTIRRFPAEQAFDLLPKMQELNGILFDEKG